MKDADFITHAAEGTQVSTVGLDCQEAWIHVSPYQTASAREVHKID